MTDTPGIVEPYTKIPHVALKLALCSTVSNANIDAYVVADYLLWRYPGARL